MTAPVTRPRASPPFSIQVPCFARPPKQRISGIRLLSFRVAAFLPPGRKKILDRRVPISVLSDPRSFPWRWKADVNCRLCPERAVCACHAQGSWGSSHSRGKIVRRKGPLSGPLLHTITGSPAGPPGRLPIWELCTCRATGGPALVIGVRGSVAVRPPANPVAPCAGHRGDSAAASGPIRMAADSRHWRDAA
jgi:hypothetical protein